MKFPHLRLDARELELIRSAYAETYPVPPLLDYIDELVALLRELINMEGPQPGTAAWADKVRTTLTLDESRS